MWLLLNLDLDCTRGSVVSACVPTTVLVLLLKKYYKEELGLPTWPDKSQDRVLFVFIHLHGRLWLAGMHACIHVYV